MNCPPEIAKILLQIIHSGILKARSQGWSKNAEGSVLELNHIHNLPRLLSDFSRENLDWYWEKERPRYIEVHQSLGRSETGFEDMWKELGRAMKRMEKVESKSWIKHNFGI